VGIEAKQNQLFNRMISWMLNIKEKHGLHKTYENTVQNNGIFVDLHMIHMELQYSKKSNFVSRRNLCTNLKSKREN